MGNPLIKNTTAPLLATVVHDLASPITMVRLNLDLIENEITRLDIPRNSSENVIKFMKRAVYGLDKVNQIINYTLDNGSSEDSVSFSPVFELRNIIRNLADKSATAQVKIQFNSRFSKKILAAKPAFQRVFTNLLNNAIEAYPEIRTTTRANNSSDCQLKSREIRILNLISGPFLVITVEDNAGGIPLNMQRHLFSQRYTTKAQGKGLGLISVKNLTEQALHGFVRCYSLKAKGTMFAVAIPLK